MPVLEIGGVTLGLREGVIALILFAAVYMAVVLLRVFRLRGKLPDRASKGPVSTPDEQTISALAMAAGSQGSDSWESVPPGMAEGLLRNSLEQEVAQLRDEVDAIRGELAALRQDMQQEVAHLQAAQAVSPIYGDAMQMAVAGYEPAMIAERCGIARAEAELVVALANSQERGVQE